jgi:uncharacterized protein YkwD
LSIWHRKHSIYKSIIFSAFVLVTMVLIGCSPSVAPPPVATTPTTSTTAVTTPVITPTPSPSSTAVITTVSSPSPSQASAPSPTVPLPIYTPAAAPFKPTSAQLELMNFVLDLINKDRTSDPYLMPKVELNFNGAAQMHAQDMIDNHVQAAHWGTDGLKPYMRYTLGGGLNYDLENSCYVEASTKLEVKQELLKFEQDMMNNDEASNWSHRDAIINKWVKKVNIGIAYTENAVALVQDFEGDYLEYYQPPTLNGNILSLSGKFTLANVNLNNVTITFDDLPQPISSSDLSNNPEYHHYGLGSQIGLILPPPPPGQVYSNFPSNGVTATKWDSSQDGRFSIQADISPILSRGKGVYTFVLVTIIGSDHYNMTNYSIFVK